MEKRLDYDLKDSGNAFILTLLVPTLLASFLVAFIKIVFPNISDTLYYYLCLALIQILFFGTYFIYNKKKNIAMIKASKIKFNLNIYQILIVCVIGLVAMYGFSSLTSYIEYLLTLIGYNTGTTFSGLNFSNIGMLIVNVLIVGLLPAICEELMFRGIILNGLRKTNSKTLVIVLSGLMFSIMHLNPEQTVYQFVLGMILAVIVLETGSIVASMTLHFFNNAFILITNYFLPATSSEAISYNSVLDHILPFVIAIVSVGIIYLLLVLLRKCSSDGEDVFNFNKKAKNENIENINNKENTESENLENNTALKPKNKFEELFLDAGKFRLLLAFSLGIVLWIIEFIVAFTTL